MVLNSVKAYDSLLNSFGVSHEDDFMKTDQTFMRSKRSDLSIVLKHTFSVGDTSIIQKREVTGLLSLCSEIGGLLYFWMMLLNYLLSPIA